MLPLEQEVLSRLKIALRGNPYWHSAINARTCVPMKVPGFESLLMCPFKDCAPNSKDDEYVPTELEKHLKEAIIWITQLQEDLKYGRAKEVPDFGGHIYRHLWKSEQAEPIFTSSGSLIPMMRHEECVDFLKLWGVYLWIATCPRTGIRFVEGIGK